MKDQKRLKIGVSIGDLNGIGPEIVLKTFSDERILELCTPVIFANKGLLSFVKKHFHFQMNFHGVENLTDVVEGKVNVVNVWHEKTAIQFGKEDKTLAKYTIASLEAAVSALKAEETDILVTAPINKSVIQSERFPFPGHTDYLAKELGGESLMFMVTEDLKVGLLTDHVPLKEVSEKITSKRIEKKIALITDSLIRDFRIRKPKIAVLGMNPHAGDKGVIGKEDDEIINPTLEELRDKGNLVFGPYASDSFFGTGNYKSFDAVIAVYHDQGLIPFKTLSFGRGVNYTAGLSAVRTSPDHGTAYGIAGQGIADEGSFRQAVFTGMDIYRNRQEYKEISANPLPVGKNYRK